MSDLADDRELTLLYEPSLLVSDSQSRYSSLRRAVLQQLRPRDYIEQMLAAEFIHGEWESQRLRHITTIIVTSARPSALRTLLTELSADGGVNEDTVLRFFTNKSVRRKVDKLLSSYRLTEANIDAEAYRQSIGDLAEINRRLVELVSRRDKILRLVEEHRAGLATPCSSVPAEGVREV